MNGGNAYDRLISMLQNWGNGAATRFRCGKVMQAEPLQIEVAGTVQEAGKLFVCDRLRNNQQTRSRVSGTLDGQTVSGELQMTNLSPMAAGDHVLMLTEDDQVFYIIDKVVRP